MLKNLKENMLMHQKMILNKKKGVKVSLIIYMILSIIIFFFIAKNAIPSNEDQQKSIVDYFLNQEFNGIVESVFIDEENHQYKTVLVKEKNEIKKLLLDFDASPLFFIIKKGDSLQKKLNQLNVKINRTGIDTIIEFEFVFNPKKYGNVPKKDF